MEKILRSLTDYFENVVCAIEVLEHMNNGRRKRNKKSWRKSYKQRSRRTRHNSQGRAQEHERRCYGYSGYHGRGNNNEKRGQTNQQN